VCACACLGQFTFVVGVLDPTLRLVANLTLTPYNTFVIYPLDSNGVQIPNGQSLNINQVFSYMTFVPQLMIPQCSATCTSAPATRNQSAFDSFSIPVVTLRSLMPANGYSVSVSYSLSLPLATTATQFAYHPDSRLMSDVPADQSRRTHNMQALSAQRAEARDPKRAKQAAAAHAAPKKDATQQTTPKKAKRRSTLSERQAADLLARFDATSRRLLSTDQLSAGVPRPLNASAAAPQARLPVATGRLLSALQRSGRRIPRSDRTQNVEVGLPGGGKRVLSVPASGVRAGTYSFSFLISDAGNPSPPIVLVNATQVQSGSGNQSSIIRGFEVAMRIFVDSGSNLADPANATALAAFSHGALPQAIASTLGVSVNQVINVLCTTVKPVNSLARPARVLLSVVGVAIYASFVLIPAPNSTDTADALAARLVDPGTLATLQANLYAAHLLLDSTTPIQTVPVYVPATLWYDGYGHDGGYDAGGDDGDTRDRDAATVGGSLAGLFVIVILIVCCLMYAQTAKLERTLGYAQVQQVQPEQVLMGRVGSAIPAPAPLAPAPLAPRHAAPDASGI